MTNSFSHYSKELYYHVIYEDGDSEDLPASIVFSLKIINSNKIDEAKQKVFKNKDNTIRYDEKVGVTYTSGSEPVSSVLLPRLKSSKPVVTNPYNTGKTKHVNDQTESAEKEREDGVEVSNKNELVKINQDESVSSNKGESNTVSTVNDGVGSERLNIAGSGGSKPFRLNMGKFKNQMSGVDSHSIQYFTSGPFQSNNQSTLRVVFVQLPNIIWYFKVGFLKMVLENLFDGDDVPLWVSSMKDIFIRKQPHGPNQLSRKKKNNGDFSYPKSIIAFTHMVTRTASTLESQSLDHAISKLHSIFSNTEGLNEALHSWSMENQAGVLTFFKNKEPNQNILEKFEKDIKTAFKSKRIINTNTALDKYMLDWDIKQFVANDLGYSHWPQDKIPSIFGRANVGSNVPDFDSVAQLTLND